MANLNAPRKAIIISIVMISAFLILAGIILSQGKIINTDKEKLKAQEKFILRDVKKSSSSYSSFSQAAAKAQDLQAEIDRIKAQQVSGTGEMSRLRQELDNAQKAQASAQEKAAGFEKENQQFKKEIEGLKSALSEKTDSEIETQQKKDIPAAAAQKLQKQSDKLKDENKSIVKEKNDLIALNKQLKSDNRSLQDINEKLKNLNNKTEEKAKEFFLQLKGKEQLEAQAHQLSDVIAVLTKERAALLKNMDRLKASVVDLEHENAVLYGKSGDAFMRAGLTDEAIEAFNNAIRLNPRNAEAHYKLGFLYKRSMNNNSMAVYHFKKYLALDPKSKSRKEIEYIIQMLSQYDWDKMPKD
jgi:tetratricopeptide (TPR) repeat protein